MSYELFYDLNELFGSAALTARGLLWRIKVAHEVCIGDL